MRKIPGYILLCMLAAGSLTGCSGESASFRPIFTTGLSRDGLFRIEEEEMTAQEAKIVLMTELVRYQTLYGSGILQQDTGGQTLEEQVKDSVMETLGKVMVMDEMASTYQIRLTAEERKRLQEGAEEYYDGMSQADLAYTESDLEDVLSLMERLALADKVFQELTAQENTEVSDDEARVITVKHIMMKTGGLSQAEKESVYSQMLEIFDRLSQGEDFDTLAQQYSEDTQVEYSFGRGRMDETFEETAFSLDNGEISTVIESAQGYHIILCVNSFDRAATDEYKIQLEKKKRWDVFESIYEEAAGELVCQVAERRIEELDFPADGSLGNATFFDIYERCAEQGEEGTEDT